MWMMLQQETPDDYVIATGKTHSVLDFVEAAFNEVGLNYTKYVTVNPAFYRPAEVEILLGDPSKAKAQLGWEHSIEFCQLVKEMVATDIKELNHG